MMYPCHSAAALEQVLELTRRGTEELNGAATTMATEQLQLLVRFDGTLTLEQIRSRLAGVGAATFMSCVDELKKRGLIAAVLGDSVGAELEAQLQRFGVYGSSRGASPAMLSLRKSGYYVEIARGKPDAVAAASDRTLTALAVEDDPILAKFIHTFLALEGFQVRQAATRAEVILELNKQPVPDIVLLDVGLPDVDGFHILRKMRQHATLKRVPVVMLTGSATREAVIRGIELGANGYVTKPFQPEALMRAVCTVLGLGAAAPAGPWTSGDATVRRKWQVGDRALA
jgi:CheY-like chemotaxis protein